MKMANFEPIVLNEREYHSKNDTGILGEKKKLPLCQIGVEPKTYQLVH